MNEFWQSFIKLGETSDPESIDLLINIMETSEFYNQHKFDKITITICGHQREIHLYINLIDLKFSSKQIIKYIHKVFPNGDKTLFIKDLTSYKYIETYGKQNNYI